MEAVEREVSGCVGVRYTLASQIAHSRLQQETTMNVHGYSYCQANGKMGWKGPRQCGQ